MVKIIDTFIFYNELDMLEFRLKETYKYVDKFILAECTHSFVGNKKELIFEKNKDRFSEYLDKIIHVIIDDPPRVMSDNGEVIIMHNNGFTQEYINKELNHARFNEAHQRNCLHKTILSLGLNKNDIITFSDLDEIFDYRKLDKIFLGWKIVVPPLDIYYYNLECKGDIPCNVFMLLRYKLYNKLCVNGDYTPNDIIRSSDKDIKTKMFINPKLSKGYESYGWHLTYFSFGDLGFIKNKIMNFCEQKYNTDYYLDDNNIKQQIKNCDDLFFRNNDKTHKLHKVNIKDNDYLPENYEMLLNQL